MIFLFNDYSFLGLWNKCEREKKKKSVIKMAVV